MNIEIGKQYINKTWRFLSPCLKGHGAPFVNRFNRLFKLSVGIHDTLLGGSPLSNGRNIYILIDKKYKEKYFTEFMSFLSYQEYFKGDYCPDTDLIKSRKHMVILEIPEEYNNAYDSFLKSQYSKMYTKEQLEILFSGTLKGTDVGILTKSKSAFESFTKEVSKEFKTIINPLDFYETEYAFPLKKREEIFNYSSGEVFFKEDRDKVWSLD